jgi:O-antigen biosynthesis protein WbqP
VKTYLHIKRVIDLAVTLLAVLITWPLFLIIMALIKLTSPGPVFFKQRRIGQNKQEFLIYKFRTMRTDTPKDIPTHLLQNPDAYITPIGGFLRKTSLDEIPQVINILRGEMSIIGNRVILGTTGKISDFSRVCGY